MCCVSIEVMGIFGVSPGFDIIKSWQGIVEMILRVACAVSDIKTRARNAGYSVI